MDMIGYFEGIDSERGLAWRCADSFSLRDFLRLSNVERVPDHRWLSRTRSRLPHEAHESGPSPASSIAAACVEHGYADGRTSTSAT